MPARVSAKPALTHQDQDMETLQASSTVRMPGADPPGLLRWFPMDPLTEVVVISRSLRLQTLLDQVDTND